MIKVGDKVFILPVYSLRYAGYWGVVMGIDASSPLPIIVDVEDVLLKNLSDKGIGDGMPRFDTNEVITVEDYNWWREQGSQTCACGKNITGAFTWQCEDCLFNRKISTNS